MRRQRRQRTHSLPLIPDVQRRRQPFQGRPGIGGTVMFLGTVRDLSDGNDVKAMTLEHYPGMTEKSLAAIVTNFK